jgi:hypothetical protein
LAGRGLDHLAQSGTRLHARQGFLAGNELKLFDAGLMLQARANIVRHRAIGRTGHEQRNLRRGARRASELACRRQQHLPASRQSEGDTDRQ